MTAPDQNAHTASKTLARGGRPHMSFVESDSLQTFLDAAEWAIDLSQTVLFAAWV